MNESKKEIGTRALAPVSSNGDVTEWKLTLKDPSRDAFTAGTASSTTQGAGYTSWPVEVAYENAGTGDSEYVSAMLCDEAGNVLYYGDIAQNSAGGTAAFDIPSGLTAGRYTLRVFSEQRNGAYQTDYASAFQDIALNVLPQETMPDAVFTATSDSRGILSDVETTMKYSVDGGVTWNDITGATMEITGVTAEGDVKLYRPGDGATTSDSEVQTIDVTQAARPQGLDKVDCTTSERDDGQITGVDNTMEYRLSVDADWIPITDDMLTDGRLTGLSEGTYQVRVRAAGMVLASPYAEVTIGAHPAPAGTQEPSGSSSSSIAASGNKSGGTGVPQTGDDSNIAFWLAVMLAAGATMSGTGIYRRKKKCGRC